MNRPGTILKNLRYAFFIPYVTILRSTITILDFQHASSGGYLKFLTGKYFFLKNPPKNSYKNKKC